MSKIGDEVKVSRHLLERVQQSLANFTMDHGWSQSDMDAADDLDAALVASQLAGDQHPDELAVEAFAAVMKGKMAEARAKGRGGWEDPAQCSAETLSLMLRDHVEKGDPRDVANFCMMLHQRGEAIAASQPVGEAGNPVSASSAGQGQCTNTEYLPNESGGMDVLDDLRGYAADWRVRAGEAAPVHRAIAEIERLRKALAARQPVGQEPVRLSSQTVDGELSVASAIDQVLELFPSSGRAALQTLAGLFTHPTIYRYAAPPAQAVDLGPSIPSGLAPVVAAMKRFNECAEDSGSEGCDIGRDWFDALTTMGLLSRTQRSPAVWTMTAEGERLLAVVDSQEAK